ncbi:hypothetical protein V8B97DRAFT_1917726 [Scleroderma yunnanense]
MFRAALSALILGLIHVLYLPLALAGLLTLNLSPSSTGKEDEEIHIAGSDVGEDNGSEAREDDIKQRFLDRFAEAIGQEGRLKDVRVSLSVARNYEVFGSRDQKFFFGTIEKLPSFIGASVLAKTEDLATVKDALRGELLRYNGPRLNYYAGGLEILQRLRISD